MSDPIHLCKVCQTQIPHARVKLGYTQRCTVHSDITAYFGFAFASSKDTREVQIIKDKATADRLYELSKSKGRVAHTN